MKKNWTILIIVLAVLAVVLIGLGQYRIVGLYRQYREEVLAYESQHLYSLVFSNGRGVDLALEGYIQQAEQIAERVEFAAAETASGEEGDGEPFAELFSRQGLFALPCLTAVYDSGGGIIAESDEGFPRSVGQDRELGGCLLRRDGDGEYWFVFRKTSERDYTYEQAVSVEALFSSYIESSRMGRSGVLFLIDREERFIVLSRNGESMLLDKDAIYALHPELTEEDWETVLGMEGNDRDDYSTIHLCWEEAAEKGQEPEETLVVAFSLARCDGFLLAAAMSYQDFRSLLIGTLQNVSGVILMEIAAMVILLLIAAWILLANRRNALALKAAQEKAEMMEEINRQQQSLYHSDRLLQLGLMTAGIVHEFNNLLTPIMSHSHMLLEELADQEDSPQFECALDIFEASENARDVLRRMSFIGKRDADMEFRTLELRAVLRRTMDLASMTCRPRIRQELFLPQEPVYISGNERLLTQAFLNICLNACQAMSSGGTLTMRAALEEHFGRSYVNVQVWDTGPGIPEEMFSHLYEPFITSKGEKGTGLGLSICKKIVESHKGTIAASNRPEGGAMFTVNLPTCPPPEYEDGQTRSE